MHGYGPLIGLKTTLEMRADNEFVHVYVVKVSARLANETLRALKGITETPAVDLQHLRRVAKPDELTCQLLSTLSCFNNVPTQLESVTTPVDLFLLIGPVASINLSELEKALPELRGGIHTVTVPLLAPTSLEQAKSWSISHWPTVYKKNNPFGPHPSIISRAEKDLMKELDMWMDMAARAAMGSKRMGYGEAIGTTIVWRGRQTSHAVALAGDGRWKGYRLDGVGNPMAHSVLRAIGMVAQKLKGVEEEDNLSLACHAQEQNIFLNAPVTPEELAVYESDRVSSNSYLCHGLEIYMTHEPCVACSMALLHSRFGRVVFGQRMPKTGGLCSETKTVDKEGCEYTNLGYGLFWRKELNWRFLAWQTDVIHAGLELDSAVHA